jgi:integrase
VAENWLTRHVRANGLRSEHEIQRLLKAHIYPRWRERPFLSIRRSDVAALLDEVQDDHGARQADYVLAIVRGVANWFAARHDDYTPPVVRGMRRTDPKTRQRDRVLNDDELRAVWGAAEKSGTYGAMVRVALLTAQRRKKVASMRWADLSPHGSWTISGSPREKGTGGTLDLPAAALSIIYAQPDISTNSYVFPGRGSVHFNSFSDGKAKIDAQLPELAEWDFHDLRRTARSLMSRAGVRSDIAERVMGHVIQGVEGVYDRHDYREEKADALGSLAATIESIVCEAIDKRVTSQQAAENLRPTDPRIAP